MRNFNFMRLQCKLFRYVNCRNITLIEEVALKLRSLQFLPEDEFLKVGKEIFMEKESKVEVGLFKLNKHELVACAGDALKESLQEGAKPVRMFNCEMNIDGIIRLYCGEVRKVAKYLKVRIISRIGLPFLSDQTTVV